MSPVNAMFSTCVDSDLICGCQVGLSNISPHTVKHRFLCNLKYSLLHSNSSLVNLPHQDCFVLFDWNWCKKKSTYCYQMLIQTLSNSYQALKAFSTLKSARKHTHSHVGMSKAALQWAWTTNRLLSVCRKETSADFLQKKCASTYKNQRSISVFCFACPKGMFTFLLIQSKGNRVI